MALLRSILIGSGVIALSLLAQGALAQDPLQPDTFEDPRASLAAPAIRDLLERGEERTEPCTALVEECFTLRGERYSSCLLSSSKHPLCANSALGALAFKRWKINPGRSTAEDSPTTATLTNPHCLNNFDGRLSAEVVSGLDFAKLQELSELLDSCSRHDTQDPMRP